MLFPSIIDQCFSWSMKSKFLRKSEIFVLCLLVTYIIHSTTSIQLIYNNVHIVKDNNERMKIIEMKNEVMIDDERADYFPRRRNIFIL